jgi:DNA-binding SARP family transcriptional activator/WD40 repeat protein
MSSASVGAPIGWRRDVPGEATRAPDATNHDSRPVRPEAGSERLDHCGPAEGPCPMTAWSYRSQMDFSVLGPLQVSNGEGVVGIRGAKERTLLAHLVAFADQVVPAPALEESLWGMTPPRSAAKALQTYVLRVRNALEPDRHGSPRLLVTDGPGYRLAVDPLQVDAERFARLATLGRRALENGRADQAASTLAEALALWRGPAYAGFETTAFGAAEAARLDELRVSAAQDRWAAELAQGRAEAAVPELERLVAKHPLHERSWGLLVLALYRAGRQGDALGALDRARTVLADELGVDPGLELRDLHARVLAQDPTLVPRTSTAALPPALMTPPRPMVGREAEIAELRRRWEEACAGAAVTVVVRGPARAGASRLAQALADEVCRSGGSVVLLGRGAGSAVDGGRTVDPPPVLVVVDHAVAPPPRPGWMTLVLTATDAPPPPGAHTLDLQPLDTPALEQLVAEYVGATEAVATATEVRRRTGGWPGAAHDETLRLARLRAGERVGAAAVATGRSTAALEQARAQLVDDVSTLHEMSRSDRVDPDVCPWRGLTVYDVSDAPWFCGRERLVAELVARLAGSRLVAVVGPSGTGKSSAVRAGLLASLADGVLPGSALWTHILLRPGAHPMRELTRQALGSRQAEVGDVLEHLLRSDDVAGGVRTVLVVDQLEEVWTACADPGERSAFLDTLADLATDARSRVSVVVVIRADFVGRLTEHAGLAALVAASSVLVGPPTAAEVRRAVERPAQRAGLELDVGLADALVTDAGGEPGLLPLLSTTLTELWTSRSGRRLTFAAYVRAGGLTGAIAHLAEEAFTGLTAGEQDSARTVLLRLAGPGAGGALTRRRVPLAEIDDLAQPAVHHVVRSLTAARLLTASDGHVEVAHEALFREWPRLGGWLAEDAAGRAVQRRLAVAAADWAAERRDPGMLWRGARLVSGLEAAEVHPDEVTVTERDFLDASRDAVEAEHRQAEERAASTARQNRLLRRLLAGMALLLVVAATTGVMAVRSRGDALEARDSADARRLAATAVNEEYLDLALLTAVEAIQAERSPETHGALLTVLARSPEIITQVRTPNRFLRAGASADGATVYLGENEDVLRALDATTGEDRWRVRTPGQPVSIDQGPGGLLVAGPGGGTGMGSVSVRDPATGEESWVFDIDDLRATMGRDARPLFHAGAAWLPDGRIAAATESHLILLTADGRLAEAIAWGRDWHADWLRAWPDGRVSVATGPGTSFVLDPARPDAGLQPLPGLVQAVSPVGTLLVMTRTPPQDTTFEFVLHDASTLEALPGAQPIRIADNVGAWFSPDGSQLALTDGELVRLYDARTGAELRQLVGHSGSVMAGAFAGDERDVLWTAGRDGTAMAWDLSGTRGTVRTQAYPVPSSRGDVSTDTGIAVAMVPPSDALGDLQSSALHLVDTATGRTLVELAPPAPCPCNTVAVDISADGSTAVAGFEVRMPQVAGAAYVDGADHLAVYDVPSGRLRTTVAVPWHTLGIGLTPDGTRAAVSGHDGVGVVDLTAGRLVSSVRQPADHYFEITQSAEVSPDGRRAVVGRLGKSLLLDMRSGDVLIEVPTDESPANSDVDPGRALTFGWTPDGRAVVAGHATGRIRFLDGHTLRPLAPSRTVTGGWLMDVEAAPDGRLVASLGTDGDVMLWDTATWRPLGQPVTDGNGWGLLAFDPVRPVLRALHERGTLVEMSVDPDDWLRDACRVANRELTRDELAVVLPGRLTSGTCSALGRTVR